MNLPIGQLIQGASQARNAFVGGQEDRKKDDLAAALMARKLERETQEQSLRDALTRAQTGKLLQPTIAPTRNIDPNSPEGIAAALEKAKGVKALETPKVSAPVLGTPEYLKAQEDLELMRNKHQPPAKEPNKEMSNANMLSLRGQFNADPGVKNAAEVATALRKVRASATDPSPAGDLSLLVGYMKLLDPGSVVREQEFATAAKSGSLPQQIQAAATKVVNGQRLTPEQRADFVKRSEDVARSYQQSFRQVQDRYSGDAKASGLDASRIVYDPFGGIFDGDDEATWAKANPPKKGEAFEAYHQRYLKSRGG